MTELTSQDRVRKALGHQKQTEYLLVGVFVQLLK